MNLNRAELAFRSNNLNLIRIGAATQVMLFHTLRHLHIQTPVWLAPLQYVPGVPIFFGISGFLISASLERSPGLGHYIRNRLLRIYPALWVLIALTALVICAITPIRLFTWESLVWFASQLIGVIYTPDFMSSFGFGSYNGSTWTIPVELQFYALLPILYGLIRQSSGLNNRKLIGWWLFFLAVALTKAFIWPDATIFNESPVQKLLRYTFVPHFYLFLTGVLAQRLRIYTHSWIRGKGLFWLGAGGLVGYCWGATPPGSVLSNVLLVVGSVSMAYTLPALGHRLLRGTDISYGVYIYHGLLLNVMVEWRLLYRGEYLLLALVLSYAAGYLSWVFVEKPALQWKRPAGGRNQFRRLPNPTVSLVNR